MAASRENCIGDTWVDPKPKARMKVIIVRIIIAIAKIRRIRKIKKREGVKIKKNFT